MPHLLAKLSDPARVSFRGALREARARALSDAEDFADLIFVFERLGVLLKGAPGSGLGGYEKELLSVAASAGSEAVPEGEELFHLVREGRNDALHQGAFARHLTEHAVQFALRLEGGLMDGLNKVRHFMVRDPTCAQPWETVDMVRQKMLANSFSFLPASLDGRTWVLISDEAIARYRWRTTKSKDRGLALARTLEAVVSAKELKTDDAITAEPDETIQSVLPRGIGHRPFLVVEPTVPSRLLGILTVYDLL